MIRENPESNKSDQEIAESSPSGSSPHSTHSSTAGVSQRDLTFEALVEFDRYFEMRNALRRSSGRGRRARLTLDS